MSLWTYVTGVIQVDGVGRTQPEVEYILKTILEHMPVVTGSERNMHVYLTKEYGHNTTMSHNEFGEFFHPRNERNFNLEEEEKLDEMQTVYLITVEGSLRDRRFEQTYEEFMHWLTVLAKRTTIDTCVVQIKGYDKNGNWKKVVINPDDLRDLFEWPSWVSGKPCWWEYLQWTPPNKDGIEYEGKPDFNDGTSLDLMTEEERKAWEDKHKKKR